MAETVRIEIPIETVDRTSAGVSKATQSINSVVNAGKRAGEYVSKFLKSTQKTQKSLASWASKKYQILLEAKDRISPALTTISRSIKGIAGKTWNTTIKAIDLITSPVRKILGLLRNPLLAAGAVLGVTFGFTDTINTYKNFEAAMSQVKSISGATEEQFAKLTAKAKEMGATTKFTAKESADAFNYMAMAGWDSEKMLDGIEGILNLAAASGEDLGKTSDIVTDALTAFRLKASDATHFSDVLAQTAASANTNVGLMGETFKYVGAMAGTLGYSIEDVGLMVGLMAGNSIKGSMAGTQLNSIFTRLSTNTHGARDAIKELGINFFDSTGKARDLSDIIDELRAATAGYTDEQKVNLANTIAGQRAQAGLLAILNTSQEDYDKLSRSINNADGAARRMAAIRLDNLSGDITLFQSALDGMKISLGERISNSWLRDIVQWMTRHIPDVEKAFHEAMDAIERNVDRMKKKFKEIAGTDEWKNAGFFGKAKILWDDFIVEPFKEWWKAKGKNKINMVAQDIGSAIGSGLKFGIATLFGIDLSETIDEGNTLGRSFAKGFSEGCDFDLISKKIFAGFGGLIKNAGKLLPGGQSADLSSLFSAIMLMKIGGPLFGLGRGFFQLGSALFGTGGAGTVMAGGVGSGTLGTMGGTSLVGSLMGSTGNAMVSGSGLLGSLASVGYSLVPNSSAGLYFGSTAGTMSGGMAALVGGLAAAGGLAAGASLISAGADTYKAISSSKKEEQDALMASAGLKFGGVAAGAAAGAALGSIVPVIGTAVGALIGAGVGGIGGWLVGNKIKEDYKDSVEEMEAMADKVKAVYNSTGISIDKTSKFASKELKDAFNDTTLSAEEFASMFQESCANIMKESFGDIKLGLTDVKKLAEDITFKDMKRGLDEFNRATLATNTSLTALNASVTEVKRKNWDVSLGMKLSEEEQENYKQTIDSFVKSTQQYISDNHYEATLALKLLIGEDTDTTVFDSMYDNFDEQIRSIKSQMNDTISNSLIDGIINPEEAKAIENLQNQITDISSMFSEAKNKAELDMIGIKFKNSGAELTAETFKDLQEQIKASIESGTGIYNDALEITLSNLHLNLANGSITQEQYDDLIKQAKTGYESYVSELTMNGVSFNLQTIADVYGNSLDGILPQIEGTTSEKLQTALNNAMIKRPNVSSWDDAFVKDMFNLEGVSPELQTNMISMLTSTAESVPSAVKDKMLQAYKDSVPSFYDIYENLDFRTMDKQMYEKIVGSNYEAWDFIPSQYGSLLDGIPEDKLDAAARNYSQKIHDALVRNLDSTSLSEFMKTYMSNGMSNTMAELGPVSNQKYSALKTEYDTAGSELAGMLNGSASKSIRGYSSTYRSDFEAALNTLTSSPFNVSPVVNIKPTYNVQSVQFPNTSLVPTSSVNVTGTATKQKTVRTGHATGGLVSGKQLSWVGEEGPEAIIPLIPSRRSRAMSLYEDVGKILGVGYNALGGIYSGTNYTGYNLEADTNTPISYGEEAVSTGIEAGNKTSGNISVNIQVSPEFVINGGEKSETDIMAIIRKNMKSMADELGGEIAERLEAVFSNMPKVGEV